MPWKPSTVGAIAWNKALRTSQYRGHVVSRKWTSFHRRRLAAMKMHCVKLLKQHFKACDFDRQVGVLQIQATVLNGYIALEIPVTEHVG